MSEKKIVVPEGMLKAADDAQWNGVPTDVTQDILQAALGWLSENPIVPTDMWIQDEIRMAHSSLLPTTLHCRMIAEWQRRMFCAPEPEVPEAVKELLSQLYPDGNYDAEVVGDLVLEAYRRGQQSKEKA